MLKVIVDCLQGCGREVDGDGDLKGRALINWSRYVKEAINSRNGLGQTPLIVAAMMGCEPVPPPPPPSSSLLPTGLRVSATA